MVLLAPKDGLDHPAPQFPFMIGTILLAGICPFSSLKEPHPIRSEAEATRFANQNASSGRKKLAAPYSNCWLPPNCKKRTSGMASQVAGSSTSA
jgi:hypothetical protein